MEYKKLSEEIEKRDKKGSRLYETAEYIGVSPEILQKKLNGILPFFAHEAVLISEFLGTENLADKLSFFYPDVPKTGRKGGEEDNDRKDEERSFVAEKILR